MAPPKKRPAPKSSASVLDERPRYVMADALSKLAAALATKKKPKSDPVKQRSHRMVIGGGSKTGATTSTKTTKSVPSRKRPTYIEVDARTRQLAGAIKHSRKPVIRPRPDKLGAKAAKSIRRDGRDQLFAGSMQSDKSLGPLYVRKQITEKSDHPYQGESRSTTKVNATWGRHRKLCISAVIIVALLVLVAVAVGVYVAVLMLFYPIAITTSTPHSAPFLNETEGLLFYDAICVPRHQGSVRSTIPKECVAGFPPNRDSCSGNGTCVTYSYFYQAFRNPPYHTVWTFNDTTLVATVKYEPVATPAPSKKTTRLLCRTASLSKLGLCDGNSCVNARVEDDSSWYNHSRWVDNCEKPNPCWYGNDNIDSFGKGTFVDRASCLYQHVYSHCRNLFTGELLFSYKAASLWLQHLRCDDGSYSTRSTVCPGLPFRLWICAMCNATETSYEYYDRICDAELRIVTSPCSFHCNLRGTSKGVIGYLPSGAECLDSTADRRKYCYDGTCFDTSIKLNEQTRPEALRHRDCGKKEKRSEG